MRGRRRFKTGLVFGRTSHLQARELRFFQSFGQIALLEASLPFRWRLVHGHPLGGWYLGIVKTRHRAQRRIVPSEVWVDFLAKFKAAR